MPERKRIYKGGRTKWRKLPHNDIQELIDQQTGEVPIDWQGPPSSLEQATKRLLYKMYFRLAIYRALLTKEPGKTKPVDVALLCRTTERNNMVVCQTVLRDYLDSIGRASDFGVIWQDLAFGKTEEALADILQFWKLANQELKREKILLGRELKHWERLDNQTRTIGVLWQNYLIRGKQPADLKRFLRVLKDCESKGLKRARKKGLPRSVTLRQAVNWETAKEEAMRRETLEKLEQGRVSPRKDVTKDWSARKEACVRGGLIDSDDFRTKIQAGLLEKTKTQILTAVPDSDVG